MKKNEIKRHFYNGQHYHLDEENKVVTLKDNFFKKLKDKKLWGKFGFKKVGGSSIGDVLEVDRFASPFSVFCRIMWIGLPILDRKYVDAGTIIEPKVIQALEMATNNKIETFDPYKYNFNYFEDKHEFIGGLPDGYIKSLDTILEIKTTGIKKFKTWNSTPDGSNIPSGYIKQAQLYTYLMGAKSFSIVATFLEEEDYENPENFPINNRKIKNWKFDLDKNVIEDDIAKIELWYKKHILSNVSPVYNEVKDKDLLQWLECSDVEEWEKLKQKWMIIGKIV